MAQIKLGSVIAGCRLEAVAGRGGMGVVYRATQLTLERPVALKVIAPDYANDERFRERFKRESLIAASIEHPNVIPVYEAGERDRVLFILMRYVEGTDLRALLARAGPLPAERAVGLLAPVASALGAAHRRGLMHRDIKPANVLIARDEEREHPYLTDFGVARHLATTSAGMTRTGAWVGTLDYMAPERMEGDRGDGRSDIYAFGCMAYQAFTGRVPYPREVELAKLHAHLNEPAPSVLDSRSDLPRAIDTVVRRAMAKDPDDRFATGGAMAKALVDALGSSSGLGPALGAIGAGGLAADVDARPTAPGAEPTGPMAVPTEGWSADKEGLLGGGDAAPRDTGADADGPPPTDVIRPPAGEFPPTDRVRSGSDELPPTHALRPPERESPPTDVPGSSPGEVPPTNVTGPPGRGAADLRKPPPAAGVPPTSVGPPPTDIRRPDDTPPLDARPGEAPRHGTETPTGELDPTGLHGGPTVPDDATPVGFTPPPGVGRQAPRRPPDRPPPPAPKGRRRGPLIAVAVVVALLVVAGGAFAAVSLLGGDDGGGGGSSDAEPKALAPIEVGPTPDGLAFGEGRVFVALAEANSVAEVDPGSGDVERRIGVGEDPDSVVVAEGAAWVTNNKSASVSKIPMGGGDPETVSAGSLPEGITSGAGAIWVVATGDEAVTRIDPSSNQAQTGFASVGPDALDITADGDTLYVSRGRPGGIARVSIPDKSSDVEFADIGAEARGLAVLDGALWVTTVGGNSVKRVDLESGEVTDEIPVKGGPRLMTAGAGAIWVTCNENGTVARIDPGSKSVTATVKVGKGPIGIAFGGDRIWVANNEATTITPIDPDP